MLGIGAGNAVNRAKLTHAVGCAEGADTLDAGIAIGGIGGVEYVAAADPADVRIITDRVVDRECIVSWHSKDVVDANVVQPQEDMLDYGCGHGTLTSSKSCVSASVTQDFEDANACSSFSLTC